MQPIAAQATPIPARVALAPAVRIGLLGGVVALLICLIGIIQASLGRAVINPGLSLGQTLFILMYVAICIMAVKGGISATMSADAVALFRTGVMGMRYLREQRETEGRTAEVVTRPAAGAVWIILSGAVAGFLVSVILAILVLVGQVVDLRAVLIQASPELYSLLTFGLPLVPGVIVLLLFGLVIGGLMGVAYVIPARIRQSLFLGLGLVPVISIVGSAFFSGTGLTPIAALLIFVIGAAGWYVWTGVQGGVKQRIAGLSPTGQRVYRLSVLGLVSLVVLLLPLTGSYPAQVLDYVGLYILMGLGLNIVVGFAGLLDLGYVAFFALGAYTMGVLTSPDITWLGFHLTFWQALPFAVVVGVLAGVILGIPVLGMRGDYLAIVTLGFGEIIRILALSNWLKPWIGGSNGITRLPRPEIGPFTFVSQQSLYYLIIGACLIAAFVAFRVKDSRLGRAWMALREDEDVAQAMGIDLVRTKLLAFATGAAFSGLAGAFFGTYIGSIYPHSFTLLISINVLAVIIVGGMGSIPGVVIGAIALAGLPELLREFSEYRLWVFGAALVLMMLTRPEGLWPEARRKLEMHEAD